jgi:hypothetical protein
MDVQTIDNGSAVAPLARLVDDRGQPTIHVRRTKELDEALNALAALGVRKLGFRFRFLDDGDVVRQFTGRRGAGRDLLVLPAIKAARHRLDELLEAAILEGAKEFVGFDRELLYECEASFDSDTRSWRLDGSGTIYEVDPNFFAVGLALD